MADYVPSFEMLEENNVREGFFEPWDFAVLLAQLPEHVKPLAEVGYMTGWRVGEILTRQWQHVDFDEGWLRLEPGETKNKKGRMFPLIPQLREILEAQHARRLEVEEQTGQVVASVFFYPDGRPIRHYRYKWQKACMAAGYWEWMTDADGQPVLDRRGEQKKKVTRLFHDLRRTAARNLVRSGIPTALAMRFTGHETESVFRRYAIADETSLKEAGVKYAAQMKGDTLAERAVPGIGK